MSGTAPSKTAFRVSDLSQNADTAFEIVPDTTALSRCAILDARRAELFAAAYDALAHHRSVGFRYNGALTFLVIVVIEIDDDPVPRPVKLVCPRGVRKQRREVPSTPVRMQDRQPRFGLGIEPSRRNLRQLASRGFAPIINIYRKQQAYWRRGKVPAS